MGLLFKYYYYSLANAPMSDAHPAIPLIRPPLVAHHCQLDVRPIRSKETVNQITGRTNQICPDSPKFPFFSVERILNSSKMFASNGRLVPLFD